jgi:hypothetical protein
VRRKSLTLLSSLAIIAASVLVAGCDLSAPTGPPGPTGTVSGTLQAGGSSSAGRRPLGGQVTLHGSGGTSAAITVGANGQFSVPATVGTYSVSGESPKYRGGAGVCRASGPLVVRKGATSTVHVVCGV